NAATGLPLGTVAGWEYESVTLVLEPGDTLTMYTDGVTDAMAPDDRRFGDDEVPRVLAVDDPASAHGHRPKRAGERLVQAVRRHANGRAQNDDIAVVSFGRLEPGQGPNTSSTRTGPTTPIRVV